MPEQQLVHFCAPTLAGIKAASLFSCRYEDEEILRRELVLLNRSLRSKGLRIVPLHFQKTGDLSGGGKCLLYMYRPEMLIRCLSSAESQRMLRREGYSGGSLGRNIHTLIEHFRQQNAFPHEIGLFLDYPVQDVESFVRHGGRDYKLCGTWKVYHNVEQAKKIFDKYNVCTRIYDDHVKQGTEISKLAVQVKTGQ